MSNHPIGISCNVDDPIDLSQITLREARDDFKTLDAITKQGQLVLSQVEPVNLFSPVAVCQLPLTCRLNNRSKSIKIAFATATTA